MVQLDRLMAQIDAEGLELLGPQGVLTDAGVVGQPKLRRYVPADHVSVDGTLLNAWPLPVAFSHTLITTFIPAGADPLGGVRFDQFLGQELGQLTNQIHTTLALCERDRQFGQGRPR